MLCPISIAATVDIAALLSSFVALAVYVLIIP
jgi:hypothetical protein